MIEASRAPLSQPRENPAMNSFASVSVIPCATTCSLADDRECLNFVRNRGLSLSRMTPSTEVFSSWLLLGLVSQSIMHRADRFVSERGRELVEPALNLL